MESKLKLSIIIPVYNLENYIAWTLDSCLKQDLPPDEYEILCINDGSQDNSIKVLRKYESEYSNVKIIDIPNGGVSHARNIGIDNACGDYIWFVDGDDLIVRNCLNDILNFVTAHSLEKYFMQKRDFSDGTSPVCINYFSSDKAEILVSHRQSEIYSFFKSYGGGGVWRAIYKTDIIKSNHVRFPENIAYSEDIVFDFKYNLYIRNAAKSDWIGYLYRQRKSSAIHKQNYSKFTDSMRNLIDEYASFKKSADEDMYSIINEKINLSVKSLLFSIYRDGDTACAKDDIKMLKEKNLYPYPRIKHPAKDASNWKQGVICILENLFSNELFFIIMVKIRNFWVRVK